MTCEYACVGDAVVCAVFVLPRFRSLFFIVGLVAELLKVVGTVRVTLLELIIELGIELSPLIDPADMIPPPYATVADCGTVDVTILCI